MDIINQAVANELLAARKEITWLKRLLGSDIRTRIVLELARLANSPAGEVGSFHREDGRIAVRITQQQLADSVYSLRETVCRYCHAFVGENLIVLEKHGFIVVTTSLLLLADKIMTNPPGEVRVEVPITQSRARVQP